MICKKCGKRMELRPNKKVWHCWFCGYEEINVIKEKDEDVKFKDVEELLK